MGWSNTQSQEENEGELEVGATLPGQELTDKDKFPYPYYEQLTWEHKKYFDEAIKLAREYGISFFMNDPIRKWMWLHGKLTGGRLHGTGGRDHHRRNLKEHEDDMRKMIPDACPFCNRRLNFWYGKNKSKANPDNFYFDQMHRCSIDRIDNESPYQIWDILMMCVECNMDWKGSRSFSPWLVYELRNYAAQQRQSDSFIPMPEQLRQAALKEFGIPKWTIK